MKELKTPVFAVSFPDNFESVRSTKISIRADDLLAQSNHQNPLFSLALLKREDLDNALFEGTTLQEKFEDSCLSRFFKSEKIQSGNIEFKGFETYNLHAHTDALWMDSHFKIKYFFALILLDDDYLLEFNAMHEKLPDDSVDAWVMSVFESIEILGDTKDREHIWKEHQQDMEKEDHVWDTAKEEQSSEFKEIYIPEDGEEGITIGDFSFDFILKDCKAEIPEFSRQLYVTIKARTSEPKMAKSADLLSEYGDDGEVQISIPAKGIHTSGIPIGQIEFAEGKSNAPYYLYTRIEGFKYDLDFNGVVKFEAGWILIDGEMAKTYHDRKYPLRIAKKIDLQGLDWSNYQFQSMEETETANPELVRFLVLENPTFTEIPEAVFTFRNLEELSISLKSGNWRNEKLPLTEVSNRIGELRELKKLHISGAEIQALPQSLSQLKDLEQLSINNCKLNSVPQELFQLPKLKFLWLATNELNQIPQIIALPELRTLDLSNNLLKTLPEALAVQPKLETLKLTGNPWETLPTGFNGIQNLELPIGDKLRLLDFEYKGADGHGLIAWDDSQFYAYSDAHLIARVDKVIEENNLKSMADALRSTVKKAIGFKYLGAEDYSGIGNHRFGGMPDLPREIEYPEFYDAYRKEKYKYEFIGQINCKELAPLQDYLPKTGMLYFFLETVHSIYNSSNNPCKVIYVASNDGLVSGRNMNFDRDDYYEMMDGAYKAYTVSAFQMNSAPSYYAHYVNKHHFLGKASILADNRDFLEEAFDVFEEPINKDNPGFEYAVNNYSFTQHEDPELQASLRLKGNPQDWVILLTVTSSGDMQWGDAGELFFVIHKSDLAKKDFSNVFVTMESS
ncbi:DUF1963 domain-containing protein [Maribacter aurantiacus]|uniref:DUF1963 domain-containing protein n=1 Tax=Maribacter aurantiacus TaxID=1882343 RepID=A0A5R8M0R3_9FLAO|nr:DUF1963 domain-containing protein [Maribacter aurantiacus]TLF43232.1 DUF1963 domain-containing protein [Maribacter aurantiacus]